MYESICRQFHDYVQHGDYESILRVYNQKSMLPESGVAQLCGFNNKDEYIRYLLNILKEDARDASIIRKAVKKCFGIETE